jgi:hypothetical protein
MTIIIHMLWMIVFIMGGYKEEVLLDFKNPDEVPEWLIINDGVMGGVSTSDIEYNTNGYLKFTGNVSLKYNGGFASFRSQSRLFNLEEFEGIKLRVRGDGKKYSFRLRTTGSFEGIAYAADFLSIKDEWQEITIPFSDFTPRFRGRIILDTDELDRTNIRQMGFLISDKQEGEFALDIDWIKAYAN